MICVALPCASKSAAETRIVSAEAVTRLNIDVFS
jgi:hypothetical protein